MWPLEELQFFGTSALVFKLTESTKIGSSRQSKNLNKTIFKICVNSTITKTTFFSVEKPCTVLVNNINTYSNIFRADYTDHFCNTDLNPCFHLKNLARISKDGSCEEESVGAFCSADSVLCISAASVMGKSNPARFSP